MRLQHRLSYERGARERAFLMAFVVAYCVQSMASSSIGIDHRGLCEISRGSRLARLVVRQIYVHFCVQHIVRKPHHRALHQAPGKPRARLCNMRDASERAERSVHGARAKHIGSALLPEDANERDGTRSLAQHAVYFSITHACRISQAREHRARARVSQIEFSHTDINRDWCAPGFHVHATTAAAMLRKATCFFCIVRM